jgi:hypothetical protein
VSSNVRNPLVALGQLLTRHVRIGEPERRPLATMGFTRGQIVAESVPRAAIPAVAGVMLGIGFAIAASGIFPAGFVRPLEPHPGPHADLTVLLLGGLALVVALLARVALALAATPLLVGVPLGLVAGSPAFRAFAGHIGAVPDPALPILLVLAMIVALVPSRRARTTATATMLKAE